MNLKNAFFVLVFGLFIFLQESLGFAAYVTMARFDINGDGEDEIIRTEGIAGATSIKIYESITSSYFYRPTKEFQIPGKLVQVPDILDLTGDQILDFYFATGSDIGIIFYDTIDEVYKRENEIDQMAGLVSSNKVITDRMRLSTENRESDLYLEMEHKGSSMGHGKGSGLGEVKGSYEGSTQAVTL